MLNPTTQGIVIFVIGVTLILLLLVSFIVTIIYKYQQKQNAYYKNMEELRIKHEFDMLKSQLEIQEQTFQNISGEIHDNIGQKLTLAKLHLNTLSINEDSENAQKIEESISLIGKSIIDLSDISRSMSSENVLSNGLIKAIEYERDQLLKSGVYKISMRVTGDQVFLESDKELVLFRIVQEAVNNIIKHAAATEITIHLHFTNSDLVMEIHDNGKGFLYEQNNSHGLGLNNLKRRAVLLQGTCHINSSPGKGATIIIQIPIT